MTAPPPLLDQLTLELGNFVELLEQESAALGDSRLDNLAGIIEEKSRLAQSVNNAWNQAMGWLRAQSKAGLNQDLDIPSDLMPHWQAIVALARRAETLNKSNGRMIEAQLQRTKGALDVLQNAARPVHLYGADGHMLDLPGQGHTLDKV
jgi:flagella synthesis protein FlgN